MSFLRYGNTIYLQNPGNAYLSADEEIRKLGDHARNLRLDIAWGSHQHWTIFDRNSARSAQHVKFGDCVVLGVHGFRRSHVSVNSQSPWYLSVRENYAYDDGHTAVGLMPQSLECEKWQIIDPANQNSTEKVKFGDSFTLKSLTAGAGFLSSGHRGVTTAPTLDRDEKWLITDVGLRGSANPAASTSLVKVPASSDPMALLSVGLTMQDIVFKATSAIPEVGVVLGPLVEFLWPKKGHDIWALVRDRVRAMVHDAIFAERVAMFEADLHGIKTTLKSYYETEGKLEKGMDLKIAVGKLDDLKERAVNLDQPERTLTHLVTLGTLHLTALRELCVHGPELFATNPLAYPQRDRDKKQRDLQQALDDYSNAVKTAKEKAIEWRVARIRIEETKEAIAKGRSHRVRWTFKIIDDYTGRSHGWWQGGHAEGENAIREIENVKAAAGIDFGLTLDHLLMPSYVWSYLSPERMEIPFRNKALIWTGPYGGPGGNDFMDDPQGQTITAFDLAFGRHDRVNVITGLRFKYGDNWGAWRGAAGAGKSETLEPDEFIIGAHGWAGKFLDGLYFLTNLGRTLGGGFTGGHAFEVKIPPAAEPRLIKTSGRCGDVPDSISLHWQYSRWE